MAASLGVKDEADGMKTWDWKESEPISTYLISLIAGEFIEKDDTWHGLTLRYVVPRGEGAAIDPTFERTKEMLDLFSSKFGVPFPWAQYAQTSVDDFVEGGMENASATTLAVDNLVNPKLASEERIGTDDVNSHELAHQWFGDLVTCKDWANLWLNEGFATYFEHYWMEQHYGGDDADYEFWRDQKPGSASRGCFRVPIVNRHFDDSTEYEGNVYNKSGWVLRMLREKLGDDDFFRSLHNYLEANRGQNVVTADLQKSIEQATSINVDQFFHQWIYRAGAPQFEVSYTYDPACHQVNMSVKQTQEVEWPRRISSMSRCSRNRHGQRPQDISDRVSQADQTFTFPADGAPLMVVFDRGDQILKTIDFTEKHGRMVYQLKRRNGSRSRRCRRRSRAIEDDPQAVAALGDAALRDPFWGIRVEALRALGRTGGDEAEARILQSLNSEKEPWVRDVAAGVLANFKGSASAASNWRRWRPAIPRTPSARRRSKLSRRSRPPMRTTSSPLPFRPARRMIFFAARAFTPLVCSATIAASRSCSIGRRLAIRCAAARRRSAPWRDSISEISRSPKRSCRTFRTLDSISASRRSSRWAGVAIRMPSLLSKIC